MKREKNVYSLLLNGADEKMYTHTQSKKKVWHNFNNWWIYLRGSLYYFLIPSRHLEI